MTLSPRGASAATEVVQGVPRVLWHNKCLDNGTNDVRELQFPPTHEVIGKEHDYLHVAPLSYSGLRLLH